MLKGLAALISGLGVLTAAVAVLHFVMMPELLQLVRAHGGAEAQSFVVPMFYINHLGSGVFLLVLGFVLWLAGRQGIAAGQRWAAWIALMLGASLLLLMALLWATLPPFFLRGRFIRLALAGLAAVGLLATIPVLANWRRFHD